MVRFEGQSLLIATHNSGKFDEFSSLLEPMGISAVAPEALSLNKPVESEDTFAGNARIKAHYAAGAANMVALADDSGLMVDALDGAPGVYTADWAQTDNGRDFTLAMGKVWAMLEANGAPEPRAGRFCCTLCLAWPDGGGALFEGHVNGRLVWPKRGTRGFGFDPLFLPDGHDETFGETEPRMKHRISHRTRAFAKLRAGCFA